MERIHNLYLHVPFCTWVCKYCDFNAYAVLEGLIPAYVEVLAREEYEREHIAAAVSIPLARLGREAGRLPRDRAIIVYCYDYQ